MHPDGSLVVPNTSILHSGMYYCLLHHTEGTILWQYELLVGPDSQYKQRDAFRFRRDVGSVEERQAGVSDGQFAGAVAASVVLTFVVGFSAGALTRTHVLRCLGAVTSRLRSPRQRRCHGPEVSVTTLPPMYDNQAFEMEQVLDDDDSARCATMETTSSSSTTSPPAKPQRSFRQKRQEEQETTAYLEGCDYMKEEEEEARRRLEEKNKGCDEEEEEKRESSGFYLLGEDGGSQTETEEDGEEKDGRESREEKEQRLEEEEVEEADEQNSNKERRESEEEEKGRDEKRVEDADEQENRNKERRRRRDEKSEEVEDGEKTKREEDGETDDETGSNKEEDTMKNGVVEGGETSPSPGRRSRVIRLYQYDEDGQRYGHLPDPAPHQAGPAPRLKQRSLSLTRLNAIMAAASAGPLDTGETGREEKEERPHFHMEI
ncbi:trichohyalin [Sebastes umbrosus]|uniref:trichohyalin n=1 Tax=Sebastes umbrosus TaxID=72105 RepID=UPI00189F51EC|nr:trichohyalin [Sebastes umbrosus]